MSTGYTYLVEEGRVKGAREFLRVCSFAFAFGHSGFNDMGERPDWDKYVEENTKYEKERLAEVRKRLVQLKSMSFDEYRERLLEERRHDLETAEKYLEKHRQTLNMYGDLKREVEAWQCSSTFMDLKSFALHQIQVSTRDGVKYDEQLVDTRKAQIAELSNDQAVSGYLLDEISDLERDLRRYEADIKKVQDNCELFRAMYEKFEKELETLD